MDIKNIEFEKPFQMTLNGQCVCVTLFQTEEHGMVKFGIEAPSRVQVNREEIHLLKKQQGQL